MVLLRLLSSPSRNCMCHIIPLESRPLLVHLILYKLVNHNFSLITTLFLKHPLSPISTSLSQKIRKEQLGKQGHEYYVYSDRAWGNTTIYDCIHRSSLNVICKPRSTQQGLDPSRKKYPRWRGQLELFFHFFLNFFWCN